MTLWGRYGTYFTAKFLNIAAAVAALPVEDALIDGEAVAFLPGGHSDFGALRTKAGGRAPHMSPLIFSASRATISASARSRSGETRSRTWSLGSGGIHFSAALEAEGVFVFAHACQLGLEGIVSKRTGSRYKSGASRNWLKCLSPEFQRR